MASQAVIASSEVLQIVGAWLLVVLIAQAVELGSLSEAVAQNVDDDLTWTCPTNPAPEGFMDRFRAVVEKE